MFLPVLAISHNYALDWVLPVRSHNRAQRKTQARKALLCQRFAEHRNVVVCGIAAVELRHEHSTQRVLKKMHQAEAMFRWAPKGRCKGPAHSVLVQIFCSSCGCLHTEAAHCIFWTVLCGEGNPAGIFMTFSKSTPQAMTWAPSRSISFSGIQGF